MSKKIIVVILAAVAILTLRSPCGCKPNTALIKQLTTPGSIKFAVRK